MALNQVNEQTHKLVQAQDDIAKVHEDIDQSHGLIGGIRSLRSAIANRFRSRPGKEHKKKRRKFEKRLREEEAALPPPPKEPDIFENCCESRKYGVQEWDQIIEEQDNDLDYVAKVLKDVKATGLEMRKQLIIHNTRLDALTEETITVLDRTKDANCKLKQMKH